MKPQELNISESHPLASELTSLRAAVARFQDEAYQSSVKLQRHSLHVANTQGRMIQLEQENESLRAELSTLRATPHPDTSPQSHPAAAQVQQLTLSLRRLSDKLSLTEEALLERNTQLTYATGEATKAKLVAEGAYELAARTRGREEASKLKEHDLGLQVKAAEEAVKMSDLVLKEYADLVRSLEAKANVRPTSGGSENLSTTVSAGGSKLIDGLSEGKLGLQRLLAEFSAETEQLQKNILQIQAECDALVAQRDSEKKFAELCRTELAQARFELQQLKTDDNTATKMVSRYMKFSQKSTDRLQDALTVLKTRHAATVVTFSAQLNDLSSRLHFSESQTEKLRQALDDLGGEMAKEAYGRRREVTLRIRLVNREEQLRQELEGWVLRAEEAAGHENADFQALQATMVQDARAFLSNSLDGSSSSSDGSLARVIAAQNAIEGLTAELESEMARRLELENALARAMTGFYVNHSSDQSDAIFDSKTSLDPPASLYDEQLKPGLRGESSHDTTFPVFPLNQHHISSVDVDGTGASTELVQTSSSVTPPPAVPYVKQSSIAVTASESSPSSGEMLPDLHVPFSESLPQPLLENGPDKLSLPPDAYALSSQKIAPAREELSAPGGKDNISEESVPQAGSHLTDDTKQPEAASIELLTHTNQDIVDSINASPPTTAVPYDQTIFTSNEEAASASVSGDDSLSVGRDNPDIYVGATQPSHRPPHVPVEALPDHPIVSPHPLVEELSQAKNRYNDLQRQLRDCHIALESLTQTVSTFHSSTALGGFPPEVIKVALQRLTDYVEDTRVELEIRMADEELAARGFETLLSIPGALLSANVPSVDSDQDGMSLSDVECRVKDFVSGADPSVEKAKKNLTRKLEDIEHDVAALKRAVHDEVTSPTELYPAPASGSIEAKSSWTSWIRNSPSSTVSPPASALASANGTVPTFGSVMTSPQLRHSPSFNSNQATLWSRLSNKSPHDPFAGLGLRVPMSSYIPTGIGYGQLQPRSRTLSTMYMLGLGARRPSGPLTPSASPNKPAVTPQAGGSRRDADIDSDGRDDADVE